MGNMVDINLLYSKQNEQKYIIFIIFFSFLGVEAGGSEAPEGGTTGSFDSCKVSIMKLTVPLTAARLV